MMDRAKYVYQKWISETNKERAVRSDIFIQLK